MQKTVYQTPELRDSNDNIIQQGAFGKNTALSNSTNDGWIDYVMNNLEALHDVVGETSPTLDANGHVVEPANLAIGDEDGNRIKESYLKLSGGKVTGIASFRTDLRMLDNQDNRWGGLYVPGTTSTVQYLSLYGGTRATGDARLNLYNTGNGKFELTGYSTDGANAYTLTHDNSGNLNWRGYPLAWKKDYLPLTGGTMSAGITITSDLLAKRSTTSNSIALQGASTWNDGAILTLYGKDHANSGRFILGAYNGSGGTSGVLRGYPDGTLTWQGYNILTASNYNSYALPLSGGTMTGIIQRNVNNTGYHELGRIRYNEIVAGTAPSGANVGGFIIQCVDSNNVGMGGIYKVFQTDGASSLRFYDNFGSGNSVGVALCRTSSNAQVFLPLGDNKIDLGSSSARWKQLYAGTTTIATSDERLKDNIEAIPDEVLDAWGEVNWYQYQFKDSIEEKGETKARIHTGAIAQRIESVFESHNLDANRYGLLCYDRWNSTPAEKDEDGNIITPAQPAGNRYSLRYEEALCMEAAYQRRRADRLEERIARLEALLTNTETEEE